jgi:hypothetical protein
MTVHKHKWVLTLARQFNNAPHLLSLQEKSWKCLCGETKSEANILTSEDK